MLTAIFAAAEISLSGYGGKPAGEDQPLAGDVPRRVEQGILGFAHDRAERGLEPVLGEEVDVLLEAKALAGGEPARMRGHEQDPGHEPGAVCQPSFLKVPTSRACSIT